MSTDPDGPIWTPDQRSAAASAVAGFARFVRSRLGVAVSDTDYSALHAWSVSDLEGFWSAAVEYLGVRFHDGRSACWARPTCPARSGFPGQRSTTPSTR